MNNLRSQFGMSVILITHNLGLVARYVDHVNVMYAGRQWVSRILCVTYDPLNFAVTRCFYPPDG
jgi:energy-coupling factor transporter ATP-binding protein EcfA2